MQMSRTDWRAGSLKNEVCLHLGWGLAKCQVMRGTLSENVHDVYTFHIRSDISGCGVLEKKRSVGYAAILTPLRIFLPDRAS